jgi:anthranilate/para-aminobenzoate synthase component I
MIPTLTRRQFTAALAALMQAPAPRRQTAPPLAAAPQPQPAESGAPLAGGLVGYAGYDVVRMFERLSSRRAPASTPLLHYVAPASLLVFDHVTRGIARLHGGTEPERGNSAPAAAGCQGSPRPVL